MESIDSLWNETVFNYLELHSRLEYVVNKNKQLLEKRKIKDKLILLSTDLQEVINTMEKISNSIDETYAEQAYINVYTQKNEQIAELHTI